MSEWSAIIRCPAEMSEVLAFKYFLGTSARSLGGLRKVYSVVDGDSYRQPDTTTVIFIFVNSIV